MEQGKLEQFFRDGADFCVELKRVLKRMEQAPADRDLVHRAFRFIHSLKSEAQFVEAGEVAAVAEEIEGILAQIRQGSLEVGTESLGFLMPLAEALEEALAGLAAAPPRTDNDDTRSSPARSGGGFRDPPPQSVETPGAVSSRDRGAALVVPGSASTMPLPLFTDFEVQLIAEAMGRGERLYRLNCLIEESAPLKYPKAYLVVNNLELVTNVIRSVPSFETSEDEAFRDFTVYFTAEIDEAEVRDAVDVDQVERIEISEIPFRPLEEKGEVAPPVRSLPSARRGPSSVRVENGRMDELARRLYELRNTAKRLIEGDAAKEAPAKIRQELTALSETVRQLQRLVNETREVSLAEEFRHLPWLIRDLSARLGKEIRIVTIGEDLRVDRRLASMLSEPLLHLVRNAVDHGIEDPQERAGAGKPREGTIIVSALERDDELLIQVGDDGRGMSLAEVTARASELGLAGAVQQSGGGNDLLTVLIQPGFSMRSEATEVSGRGVGLDAIHQKVGRALGGVLRLQTRKGDGSLFTISVPGASTMMSLLMVRSGRYTVGVPQRNVLSVHEVSSGSFRLGDDGLLAFDHLPLYATEGRLTPADVGGATYQVIILGSGQARIAFMGDELLFERDLPERNLSLGDPIGPLLRKANIGSEAADFFFLDSGRL